MQRTANILGNGGSRKAHYRGCGEPLRTKQAGALGRSRLDARDSFLSRKIERSERIFLPVRLNARECRQLVASATNFAAARGGEVSVQKKVKDNAELVASLYNQLKPLCMDCETLSLFHDEDDGETRFVLKNWPMDESTVYFIPFKYTFDLEDKELGLLIRRFLRTLDSVQKWGSIYETFYFEAMMENYEYERDEEMSLLEEYKPDGRIYRIIHDLYGLPLLTADEFKAFKPRPQDRELYDRFAGGIEFITTPYDFFERCWSMSHYRDIDPDIYGGEEPIVNPIEELFSIVYDYDSVIETIVSDLSSYYQCGDTEQDIIVEERVLMPKGVPVFDREMNRFFKFLDAISTAGR